MIADFLEALELDRVTIVGNDSGGAMSQVLVTRRPERVGRLVLTNCDTHDNFPPSLFKLMPPLAKLPGAMTVMGLPFPDRRRAPCSLRALREDEDPGGADRQLDGARAKRSGGQARYRQGHRRHE